MLDSKGKLIISGDTVELIEDINLQNGAVLEKGSKYYDVKPWYVDGQLESSVLIEGEFVQLVIQTSKLLKLT